MCVCAYVHECICTCEGMSRPQMLLLVLSVWPDEPLVVYCTRAQFQQENLQGPSPTLNNSQALAMVLLWVAKVDLSSYQLREASQWILIFCMSFLVTRFSGKESYLPKCKPWKGVGTSFQSLWLVIGSLYIAQSYPSFNVLTFLSCFVEPNSFSACLRYWDNSLGFLDSSPVVKCKC